MAEPMDVDAGTPEDRAHSPMTRQLSRVSLLRKSSSISSRNNLSRHNSVSKNHLHRESSNTTDILSLEPGSDKTKLFPDHEAHCSSFHDEDDNEAMPAFVREGIDENENSDVMSCNATASVNDTSVVPILPPAASTSDNVLHPPTTTVHDGPKPIEIAFCFDTTGSMSTCIEAVKENVKTIIQRLFMDIPFLKIAVLAHGDYCDSDVFYLYKLVNFTNDVNALCTFVNDVEGTGGGDWEECYELMLLKSREELCWSAHTQKSLVMIGDAIPHLPDYLMPNNVSDNSVSTYKLPASPGKPIQLHWMTELDRLHQQMVRAYYVLDIFYNYLYSFNYMHDNNVIDPHDSHLFFRVYVFMVYNVKTTKMPLLFGSTWLRPQVENIFSWINLLPLLIR